MDKFQSPPIPPRLPRKRNTLSSHIDEQREVESTNSEVVNSFSNADQDKDAEILAAFEQAVKDTASSTEVDLAPPSANRITAPLINDYIDPFTVPAIEKMFKKALEVLEAEEIPEEDFAPSEKEEK